MTVLITLTTAGTDTGPFNLYSDLDGFITPFESNVNKAALMAGYLSSLVPDYTDIIKVQSAGGCVNYINISLVPLTTTTTSTTSSCLFYEYNFTNALCSSCASLLIVGGIVNAQPLVIGKWYYDSLNQIRINPTGFIGCHAGPATVNINPASQQDTCAAVICPTTTTTTTLPPLFGIKLTIAHPDGISACTDPNTLVPDWYSTSDPTIVGSIIYNDPAGTSPFAGGGNWYHMMPDDSALQINGSGVVLALISC